MCASLSQIPRPRPTWNELVALRRSPAKERASTEIVRLGPERSLDHVIEILGCRHIAAQTEEHVAQRSPAACSTQTRQSKKAEMLGMHVSIGANRRWLCPKLQLTQRHAIAVK